SAQRLAELTPAREIEEDDRAVLRPRGGKLPVRADANGTKGHATLQRLAERTAPIDIPKLHCRVPAGRCKPLPVRSEGEPKDRIRVQVRAERLPEHSSTVGVPQSNRAVGPSGRQSATVRAERELERERRLSGL